MTRFKMGDDMRQKSEAGEAVFKTVEAFVQNGRGRVSKQESHHDAGRPHVTANMTMTVLSTGDGMRQAGLKTRDDTSQLLKHETSRNQVQAPQR